MSTSTSIPPAAVTGSIWSISSFSDIDWIVNELDLKLTLSDDESDDDDDESDDGANAEAVMEEDNKISVLIIFNVYLLIYLSRQ